ncbi:hypothetical protein AURDEDRAFT_160507 [Auricularia subglabra TFB-10046 SS5]|nr:hypothetical protein AURDEDRAFT_160507 [Auricularia subglabra TFB-10046 SS5]
MAPSRAARSLAVSLPISPSALLNTHRQPPLHRPPHRFARTGTLWDRAGLEHVSPARAERDRLLTADTAVLFGAATIPPTPTPPAAPCRLRLADINIGPLCHTIRWWHPSPRYLFVVMPVTGIGPAAHGGALAPFMLVADQHA